MIMSLFSIFDPSTSTNLIILWICTPCIIILTPSFLFIKNNHFSILIKLFSSAITKEFKPLLQNSSSKRRTIIICRLFVFIAIRNSIGLLPYVFTRTSHIVISMRLAIPLWLRSFIYSWVNHTQHALAHLTPLGTPTALIMFIVLIELIRALIRPITLRIRLSANIIAGHLLISLITSGDISIFTFVPILRNLILITLESAVALIQAYVFSILITLYIREVYVNTKPSISFSR